MKTIPIEEIKRIILENDKPLNLAAAADFLSISKSALYQLTSKKIIPFYRPNGKMIYFEKSDLKKWLLRNRVKSEEELEREANKHVLNNERGAK